MKLVETIERCEKLVLKEIECYNLDIEWHKKNIFHNVEITERNKQSIQKANEEKNELLEVLNNLRFIKFESNIQELDELEDT
jgi:hypothetical protein